MLNVIYSKSNLKNIKYIFEKIKNENEIYKESVIIVPICFDQDIKKIAHKILGASFSLQVTILDFENLCMRILETHGPFGIKKILENEKLLIIYKILIEKNKNFKIFKNKENYSEMASLLLNTIEIFKKQNISSLKYEKKLCSIENKILKEKIEDLFFLISEYEKEKPEKLFDYADYISFILNKKECLEFFKDKKIYIACFNFFYSCEYELLNKILKACKTTIGLQIDQLEKLDTATDLDIFKESKIIFRKIMDAANLLGVKVSDPIFLKDIEDSNVREDILFLKKNFFKSKCEKYKNIVENIKILKFQNLYQEVDFLAKKIINLVKKENYELKEIKIIVPSMKSYERAILSIFKKYGINVFLENKKNILKSKISVFLTALIEILRDFSPEKIITIVKSGFIYKNFYEICEFENYVSTTYFQNFWKQKSDWTHNPNGFDMQKVNNVRKKVILPIIDFLEDSKRNKSVKNIIDSILNFLDKIDILNKINSSTKEMLEFEKEKELSEFKETIDCLGKILILMRETIGVLCLNYREFLDIFIRLCKNKKLENKEFITPHTSVYENKNFKIFDAKVIFILGLNKESFDALEEENDLFSDYEYVNLLKFGIILDKEKLVLAKKIQKQLFVMDIILGLKNKLFMTYLEKDFSNKTLSAANLIDKIIKKIFPDIEVSNASSEQNSFEKMFINLGVDKINESSKIVKHGEKTINQNLNFIEKNTTKQLLGIPIYMSVSKIEKYNLCHFAFFIEYCLKLKNIKKNCIDSRETGIILHEIISTYFKNCLTQKIDYNNIEKNVCIKDVQNITINILNRVSKKYINLPKFNFIKYKILSISSETIWSIVNFYKQSDFRPLGFEVKFGRSGDFDGEVVEIDGIKITLEGIVDRVDFLEVDKKKYISILDYKSSNKNFSYKLFEVGAELQPFVYEKVICKKVDRAMPFGVFYMKMDCPIADFSGEVCSTEIDQKILQNFNMKSIFIENEEILSRFEKNFLQNTKPKIPGEKKEKSSQNHNKRFFIKRGCKISENEMLEKLLTTEKKLQGTLKSMLDSNFNQANISQKKCGSCNFCDLKNLCAQL